MNHRPSRLSALAAPVVLGLFALCLTALLLAGAGVYRRMVDSGDRSYAARTCAQYVGTKVRQCENAAALGVEDFQGVPALVIAEQIENTPYITRIYCHEGWLMELFSAREGELSPENGEKLLPAQAFSCELQPDRLQVTVVDGFGRPVYLTFALRGEGAGS